MRIAFPLPFFPFYPFSGGVTIETGANCQARPDKLVASVQGEFNEFTVADLSYNA